MDSQFIVVKQTARTTSTCCRLCLLHSSDLQPITDLTVDSHGPNEPVASPLSQLIARYLSIEVVITVNVMLKMINVFGYVVVSNRKYNHNLHLLRLSEHDLQVALVPRILPPE